MKYVTLRATAKVFGRSYETIRLWLKAGRLTGHQDPITHIWYIDTDSVLALMHKFEEAGFKFDADGLLDKEA